MENRSTAAKAGRNILAVVLFLAIFAVMARLGAALVSSPLIDACEVVGGVLALWVAVRLRAVFAGVLIAGFDLFLVVEFTFHLIFGYRAVQSGPTHLAIMTASIVGVALAASVPRLTAMRNRTS